MRDGANRGFALALLASFLLHALALAALPSLRELAARLPPIRAPLIARLAQREAPPAPAAAHPQVHRPAPPKPTPAVAKPPAPALKPPPPLPLAHEPQRQPAAPPAPAAAPAPQAVPAASEQTPVASAPPAAAAASVAGGALARLEPVPAAQPGPDPGALDRYQRQLVTVAARFKRYPRSAIDNNWEGAVVVRMTIGADGRIAALGVSSSSGHEVLDRQALDMFRTAKPFVQLPPELAGREFELELRAIYSLRDQPSG